METKFIQKDSKKWETIAKVINKAEWGGAKHLSEKMINNKFSDWEGVVYIEENKNVLGFCSIVKKDIADNLDYSPYIAVVYVFPEYRGQFLTRHLIDRAEFELKKVNYENIYLITQLKDFYEKLGYSKIDEIYDNFDRLMSLYHKSI